MSRNGILIAILLVAMTRPAIASANEVPACASQSAIDPDPGASRMATIQGFPGQKVYLHAHHPDSCPSGAAQDACMGKAFVLVGDRVTANLSECDSYVLVSFSGQRKTTVGWVINRDLADPRDETLLKEYAAQPILQQPPSICRALQNKLNDSLDKGSDVEHALTHAEKNDDGVHKLPDGIGQDYAYGSDEGEAAIEGKKVRVVDFHSEGTCYDDSTELWSPNFKESYSVSERFNENEDEDNGTADPADWSGYTSEGLVTFEGKPYFVHYSRADKYVKMYGFNHDLSSQLVCELVLRPQSPEPIRTATDRSVCEAVQKRAVQNVEFGDNLADVDSQALGSDAQGQYWLSGRRKIDLDNDGKPETVAMASYQNDSGAGCGFDYSSDWPVVLNQSGKPDLANPLNNLAFGKAGADAKGRLFLFQGKTYFEHRTVPTADAPDHEIWKFSKQGAEKVCDFEPMRYEIIKPFVLPSAAAEK